MFYDYSLTIPANTTEASPTEQEINLTHGVIHRLEVEFPPGCAGLAHLVIDRFGHQLWPTNPESSFASDAHIIGFNEYHELFESPYELRLRGWNEDDSYPHEITVRIGILPEKVLAPGKEELGIIQKLGRFFLGG